MNGHCINIAISGISLKVSDELKIELRKTIPHEFGINWINISDPNLDLLLINELDENAQSELAEVLKFELKLKEE